MKPIQAVLVAHTHWDREWYLSFQQFRARLVGVVDYVIELLERDERFTSFTLDGQSVILEDYLEIRPENQARLRALVGAGRLVVGPWYVLPDEFLTSEEAILRNLLLGQVIARRFGHSMDVGHVPDPFGHIGQLPQILRGFGIESAMFSRGMGDEGETLGAEFRWRGPDGSEVLGLWLTEHYGSFAPQGSFNPWESDERFSAQAAGSTGRREGEPGSESVTGGADADLGFAKDLIARLAARSRTGVVLLMAGSDHLAPRADLPAMVESIHCDLGSAADLVIGSLEDYVRRVAARLKSFQIKLAAHDGEFRGSRYQNMLSSVLSARMGLKQANHLTDNLITRYAEPLACAAWLLGGDDYPTGLLRAAWKPYLHNQAHDSICGCSTDQVAMEMEARYAQVQDIAAAVSSESMASIARMVDTRAVVLCTGAEALPLLVFNPNPWTCDCVVEACVPVGEGIEAGSGFAVRNWNGEYLADAQTNGEYPCEASRSGPPAILHDRVLRGEPHVDLCFPAEALPPMGFRVYFVSPRGCSRSDQYTPHVHVGDSMLENDWLSVLVSDSGTVDVRDRRTGRVYRGLNVFEDSGDIGDEYDYCPALDPPVLSGGGRASVRVARAGPHVGTLRVQIPFEIPVGADRGSRRRVPDTTTMDLATYVTLTSASPYVAFRTEIVNTARDHRLRALFPTGVKTDCVHAQAQFDVVRRQVAPPEPRPEWFQAPAPIWPFQGFVDASDGRAGMAVVTRGLPECECLTDGDGSVVLAVTLLRCVEWLSRDDLTTRRGHAGPPVHTPGAQCQGNHVFEYAIVPHSDTWVAGRVAQIARGYLSLPVCFAASVHPGHISDDMSLLELADGPALITAVKKAEAGDALVVRLHNPTSDEADAILTSRVPLANAGTARLDETPCEGLQIEHGPYPAANSDAAGEPDRCRIRIRLGAKQIATVLLYPAADTLG